MRGLIVVGAFLVALVAAGASGSSAESDTVTGPKFRVVDIYIDSDSPLSAYQVEVNADSGEATVVGVEGGEAPMNEPPFYDPAALAGGHIVLAAFNTEAALTAGPHRIASVHVRETTANVHYSVLLRVAADAAGVRKSARVYVEPRPEVKR